MLLIADRQEIAKALNFGNYPVLGVDLENKPYPDEAYVKGCWVNVAWDKAGYEGMSSECQLVISNGKYELLNYGCMMKASYGLYDFLKDVERANYPMIHKGQVVAVAHYSKPNDMFMVRMMQVSERINIHSQVVAELVDVPDDFKLKEVR